MSSIRVALRIRPEIESVDDGFSQKPTLDSKNCLIPQENTVSIRKFKQDGNSEISHQYTFDHVFDEDATQDEVFSNVKDLVDDGMKGFNATIFAFGMTGSGKTHTISGSPDGHAGIVPRAVHHVFSNLRGNSEKYKDNLAMVFLTFVELYNNTFYDLLAPSLAQESGSSSGGGKKDVSGAGFDAFGASSAASGGGLKLQEHPGRGMTLVGSRTLRVPVTSAEETLSLIEKGYRLRATASTNMNERSSRSHTVISLEVMTRENVAGSTSGASTNTVTKMGKINLVDLAGSERVKVSGATGQTLTEAKQINKALSVLGDVMNALSKKGEEESKPSSSSSSGGGGAGGSGSVTNSSTSNKPAPFAHVPYRNSKLTMLLKDSLGGNSKTMMIATVRQSASFYQQTLTSLQYAARARHIKCNPVMNIADVHDSDESGPAMQRTLNEVTRLKMQLDLRTAEFDSLKSRLEAVEKEKARAVQQAVKKSAAEGALSAAVVADSRENDRKISEYRRMIDSLKRHSDAERKELQAAMKFVIHNHEGHLAMKEKEFVSLEEKLHSEVTRAAALVRDKDDALQTVKQADLRNRELYQQNVDLTRQVERVKMDLVVMKRSLRDAEDRAGAVAMSESDREQFVEALQRLTASRAKHKERGDAAEAQLASLGGDLSQSRAAVATLTAQMSKLGNKMIELEEKKEAYKAKTLEQDRLMAAAVVRIKTLEAASSGAGAGAGAGVSVTTSSSGSSSDNNNSSGSECELISQDQVRGAHIATAAASASAIVAGAVEAMGGDYARVQQLYEEKSNEFVAYRLEVEARDMECQQVLRLEQARRAEWDAQLAEMVKQLDQTKEALAEKTKALCALEDSQLQVTQTSITASSELGALQAQYTDLQQQLQSVQSSQLNTLTVYDTTKAELETVTRAHADSERRVSELLGASAKSMRDQVSEREMHASEMKVMSELHEQLKTNNIALETQLVAATSQVQELTERFNGGAGTTAANSKSGAETGQPVVVNPVAVGEAAGAASATEEDGSSTTPGLAGLSPGSENKFLKNTITALKQQEQVMFFALEDKLKDLDAARNRLVSLKKAAQRQKSDDLLSRLRRDVDGDDDGSRSSGKSNNNSKIMERMLNSAKQEQEKMHAKLISSEHENKELKIRLESAQALLDKERKAGQELADELSEQRDDSEAEISRLSALVRKAIDDNQVRRSHDFEALDSSIDTNASMSPEKGRVGAVRDSSPGPSPIKMGSAGAVVNNTTNANDNAAEPMDVIVEDVDDDEEDDMEFYDVGEVPDWIDG